MIYNKNLWCRYGNFIKLNLLNLANKEKKKIGSQLIFFDINFNLYFYIPIITPQVFNKNTIEINKHIVIIHMQTDITITDL